MVKSVISATHSPFPINLAAMPDHVNHDKLLVVKHLIKDTVVADTKLVESCKTARHRFRVNIVQILSQPIDTLNDTPANWLVKSGQFTGCRVQNLDAIHAGQSSPSRLAASANDSPRWPDATAFLWRTSRSRTNFLMVCPLSGSSSNSRSFRSTVVSIISLSSAFVIRDTVAAIPRLLDS